MKNVSLHTLSNGLKVAVFNYPHLVSTEMIVMFKGGPVFEKPTTSGITYFLEHMLLTGTKKYNSKTKIDDAVKKIGAYRNGYTSRDRV